MLIGTSLFDWLKPTVPTKPDVTLTPQPDVPEELIRIGLEPDVTLTPQLAPQKRIGALMPGLGTWKETRCERCDSKLRFHDNPSLGPKYNISAECPICGADLGVESVRGEVDIIEEGITTLGAEAEWLKKNRSLVIVAVVIIALVLLSFFLKKGRR